MQWNYFRLIEIIIKLSFYLRSLQPKNILKKRLHFLVMFVTESTTFIFLIFFHFHINSVCILFNKLIIDVCIFVTKARWIIFEIVSDLKTTIFSSIVKFLSFHNLKMLWYDSKSSSIVLAFYYSKRKYLKSL